MTYSSLLTCSFWSSLTHSAWHHLFPPFFSSFPHTFSTVNSCPTTATIILHGKAIFLNFCNSKYVLPIYVFSNICFQIKFKESLKTCSLILSYHVHQMCKCVSESTGPKKKVVPKPPPQNFWYVKFEHSKLCFSQAPAWGWCSFVKCSLKELFVVIIHTDIVSKLLIYVIIMPLYIKLLKTRRLLHEAPNYFSPTAHLKGKILNTFFLVLLLNKFLFAYIFICLHCSHLLLVYKSLNTFNTMLLMDKIPCYVHIPAKIFRSLHVSISHLSTEELCLKKPRERFENIQKEEQQHS